MIKADISNNDIVHVGNFGINVVINYPLSDLVIDDFIFTDLSGNGITDILFPDNLEIVYVGRSKQTLTIIPIDLPDDVEGSFSVSMRSREYTVDNTQYELLSDAVSIPATEHHSIECKSKIFRYNTFEN